MSETGPERDRGLGPLESKIMDCLWRTAPATPGDVRDAVDPEGRLAYTTVMTVMTRLVDKGLLVRVKRGRAYAYSPVESKLQHLGRRVATALGALSRTGEKPALSYFVDAASAMDDDQLAELEAEIARLRGERR